MMQLREIQLKGFKSIDGQAGQTIPFGDITVLVGANGSGKSNLVDFFKMLQSMTTGALQQYVGKQGVSRLLFFGPKQTESLSFRLQCESDDEQDWLEIKLSYGIPDRLFVDEERIRFHRNGESQPREYSLESGSSESEFIMEHMAQDSSGKVLQSMLSGIRTYQFHDTSDTAKIKDRCYVDDAKYLRSDGGNLAAFLKMLKGNPAYKRYYDRIVRHIQRVMPQFGDFDVEPIPGNGNYIRLNWHDVSGNGYLFDPNQISDGSLRFMAMATLLLQPPELLPKFIVIDEPELGLHPAAIAELAGIVRLASQKTQVLLATQSTRLMDEFSADDVVVVERDEGNRCSVFKKLDTVQLKEWLDRYSLSELWEKNVLGGRP